MSVYSRFLDFNLRGCLTQGRLDLLLSSLNLNLWVTDDDFRLFTSSLVFNVDSGILSEKLNWQKSLPCTYESRKKLYPLGYRFKGGLDMRFYRILDVSPGLIFKNNLTYNVYFKPI